MRNKKNNKPRIGIIGLKGLPAYGGSARAGENMIALLKDKCDFTIYTVGSHTDRKTGYYDGYRQIVFKEFPIKSLNTFLYYLKATMHALFFGSYSVMHVFHLDAAFIIPILKLKYKIIGSHRARPQEFSKWNKFVVAYFNFMEWIFYKVPADVLTTVSKSILDGYQKETKREIKYIPNGIIMKDLEKGLPKIDYEEYILFASGRIIETKGCHFMLEALSQIKYKGLIVIVGNLQHTLSYSNYLKSFKSKLNIVFTGLIKDKKELMSLFKHAKLAIYPSMHEGMSNTLLEMASMKTPVICSDIPENRTVFNDSEMHFFKNKDVEDLKQQIVWALNNSDQMQSKTENAYKRLELEYNWERIAATYYSHYQELSSKANV